MNYILLYIVFIIILFFIIYRIAKKFLKTLIIFSIIFILLTSFLVLATVMDAKELYDRFPNEQSAFILTDQDKVLTGASFQFEYMDFKLLNEEDIKLSKKELLKSNYKLIEIKIELLDKYLADNITNHKITLSKQEIIEALKSDNPLETIDLEKLFKTELEGLGDQITNEQVLAYLETQDLETEMGNIKIRDKAHIKAMVFVFCIEDLIDQEDPFIPLKEFKNNNIKIHKETLIFKLAKSLPIGLIESIVKSQVPELQ